MAWGYRLAQEGIYETVINQGILDDSRRRPLQEMAFADPASVDGKAQSEDGREVVMLHGYPVKAETAPKKFLWQGGKRALPEVLSWNEVLICNERFRLFVEAFEPGRHQFIPVDIFKSAKGQAVATYFWFSVLARVDTVDAGSTTYRLARSRFGTFYWSHNDDQRQPIPGARIVFDESKAGNYHIWVEPTLLDCRGYHCSLIFGDAAIAEKFTGLVVTPRSSLYFCKGA